VAVGVADGFVLDSVLAAVRMLHEILAELLAQLVAAFEVRPRDEVDNPVLGWVLIVSIPLNEIALQLLAIREKCLEVLQRR